MAHSPHHTPHEICFVLESVAELEGKGEVFLRVSRLRREEEEDNEWVRVLTPSFPLYEPLGCYYLLSLQEGSIVEELELRIDLQDKSYGAAVRLKGEVKTRGRVQLYNEMDPSEVIMITVAVLIRILPLTPREYREATTQTPSMKRIDRWVQTEMKRENVSIATSPIREERKEEGDNEEERRKEVADIVEKTIKRRLLVDDLPSIDNRSKNLSEEVIEMRRSLRLLGKEERSRREKGEEPPKESTTVPLTPPDSPTTPSSSSSSESTSSSSSSTSSNNDSKISSSTTSSSTATSSSSSSQESVIPNISPTSEYINNLRERLIAERRESVK